MAKGNPLVRFLIDVWEEVEVARSKFPHQENFLTLHEWNAILVEEVGEVSRCLNEGGISGPGPLDRDALYRELIQTAAMAGRFALSVKERSKDASTS